MSDFEYLYTEYGYDKDARRYIKCLEDIEPYFEEDYTSYFTKGQGIYHNYEEVLVFVDGKSFVVKMTVEVGNQWMEIGDKFYYPDSLKKIEVEEVETPLPKERFNCVFQIDNITNDDIIEIEKEGLILTNRETI